MLVVTGECRVVAPENEIIEGIENLCGQWAYRVLHGIPGHRAFNHNNNQLDKCNGSSQSY